MHVQISTKIVRHAIMATVITVLLFSLTGCDANSNGSSKTPNSIAPSDSEYNSQELGKTQNENEDRPADPRAMEDSTRIKDELKETLKDVSESEAAESDALKKESLDIDSLP